MHWTSSLLLSAGAVASAAHVAPRQTPAPSETTAPEAEITAVTDCHPHGTDLYCVAGTAEYLVVTSLADPDEYPTELTDCHTHDTELFCVDSAGEDVEIVIEGAEEGHEGEDEHEGHGHEEEGDADASNENCHSHAGVEHCTGGNSEQTCEAPSREYDIGLRVGLLFVIMATSALGVFGPILLQRVLPDKLGLLFVVLKQFGTGIIISTAFVHLYTHASLMFANECLGELEYEGVTSAIVMAGLFLSFLVEYIGQRAILSKAKAASRLSPGEKSKTVLSNDVLGILVMEAGIVFHSLLIGLTLVVAGDEYFLTLFAVILFHQMFEGIALGTRIASIGEETQVKLGVDPTVASGAVNHASDKTVDAAADIDTDNRSADSSEPSHIILHTTGLSLAKKLGLAGLFAFVTPIGMAIGIGVLDQFNGNNRSTIIAIGTLDALSAGILIWVGVVEMWAADWMLGGTHSHGSAGAHQHHGGELADANLMTVALAMFGLVSGLVVMSVLGKWA